MSHHDAQFDGYAGELISVVTPLPPTVLPLDGPANVPSDGDQNCQSRLTTRAKKII